MAGAAVVLLGCGDAANLTTPSGAAVSAGATLDKSSSYERHDAQVVTATGDISAAVGQFRTLLGGGPNPNPNVAGDLGSGRREINWDGVPAAFTNNDQLPGNFFNVTSFRGAVFTTDGTGFRITNQGFIEVNPNYTNEFNTFSPPKLFVAAGSTITDVNFFVAGTNTPAQVTGFGSVFADVGRSPSTTIEFFDAEGHRLLEVRAPKRSDDKGLSFAGAVFEQPIIARVRITSGDTPLAADQVDNVKGRGKKHDLVAMDDFIYGEPHAQK
jgi:hypothetical protein